MEAMKIKQRKIGERSIGPYRSVTTRLVAVTADHVYDLQTSPSRNFYASLSSCYQQEFYNVSSTIPSAGLEQLIAKFFVNR